MLLRGQRAQADPVEYRLVGPAGPRRMLCRTRAVAGPTGEQARVVGTIQDITHHREQQEALEVHARLLEQAQAVAHVGSWVWRLDSQVITWSPELYRITGHPPDHRPTVASFDAMVHPDDLPRLQRVRQHVLRTGIPEPIEIRIVRLDGTIRQVVMHAKAIEDPPSWYLGIVHDVTEQRQLEQRLRRSQTLEAVGRLASGVAHDFNNLLTVMIANLELAPPCEELDDAMRAATTAAELTQRLLFFGRSTQAPLIAIDLDAALQGARALLSRAIAPPIELRIEASSGATIRGDRRQLDQVLLNLVINARDAIVGAGAIEIRSRQARDGGALIEVIDDGTGMDAAVHAHALEPFFTTKAPGRGTGLGLAMVQGALASMGGELSIDTPPEGGTRVMMWFPGIEQGSPPPGPSPGWDPPGPGSCTVSGSSSSRTSRRSAPWRPVSSSGPGR